MKKVLNGFLAIAIFAFVLVGLVQAANHPITNVSVISAPFGTGSYVLSTALEDISKKFHPWLRITASETPGLVFNTKKLNKEPHLKKSMFMSYTVGINWLAQSGRKPFKKEYPSAMLLANYNLGSVWLASLNPKIKTREDLVGKKIAIGRGTQILWAIEPEWVIRYGWGLRDKIKIQYVGTKPAMTALMDGLVDAGIVGGYADPIKGTLTASPQTLELLASGKTLYHIPWGEEAVRKVIDKGIPIAPVTLPAKAIPGLKHPLPVFCDPIAWCVYPEFPEDIAYEITKLIINYVTKFKDYHALGKLMTTQSLPFGWDPERIHPGALKAYKEAGVLK